MTPLLMPLLMLPLTPQVQRADTARFVTETYVDAAGTEHRYRLYVPAAHNATVTLPLVVALHGCTQTAEDFAAGTRLNEAAERDGVLVAYPEQRPDAHPTRCWNWYLPAHQARGAGEVAVIAGITAQVQTRYRADTQRTWLLGMSAGAAMAALTAAAYPELFSALALHSGLAYGAAQDLAAALVAMREGVSDPAANAAAAVTAMGSRARRMPTIVFHGVADAVLVARNGEQAADQWLRTNAPFGTTTAATTHGTSPGGYTYTRTVHARDDGNTVVELWLVQELAHAWSGGDPAGSYTDANGPDATREILRFFRSVTR